MRTGYGGIVLTRPWLIVGLTLLLAMGAAMAIPGLAIEPDGRRFLAADHPVRRVDADMAARHTLSSPVVVAVIPRQKRAATLSIHTVLVAQTLAHDLGQIPGLADAAQISLFTLKPGPGSPLYVDWDELTTSELFAGLLLGTDRTSIVITLLLDDTGSRHRVLGDVQKVVTRYQGRADHDIHVAGAPVAENTLTGHILGDLAVVVPLVMLVVGLMLLAGLGSMVATLVALADAALTLLFTAALMVAIDTPIYLPTTVVPVLLVAISVCDDLHIVLVFGHERAANIQAPLRVTMGRVLDQLRMPVIVTSLTTAAGLASFALGDLVALRSVGLVAAAGVLVSMLLSLTLVPALLILLARIMRVAPRPGLMSMLTRLGAWISRPQTARAPWLLALVVLTAIAAWNVRIQDSWLGNFAADSEVRRAHEAIEARVGGTHRVLVEFDGGRPGAWHDPAALAQFYELEQTLCDRPEITLCMSPASLVREIERCSDRDAGIPATAEQVRIDFAALDTTAGQRLVRGLASEDGRYALIHMTIRGADYATVDQLIAHIRSHTADWRPDALPPLRLRLGGDAVVSHAMIAAVVEHQIASLVAALIVAVLMVGVFLRSLRLGLLAVLPAALAVAALFALMALSGITLGIATAMLAGIVIGVGIDYSVHILCRSRAETALAHDRAAVRAAVLLNSLVVAAGLLALLCSSAPPLILVGGLAALSLVMAGFLAVRLSPG